MMTRLEYHNEDSAAPDYPKTEAEFHAVLETVVLGLLRKQDLPEGEEATIVVQSAESPGEAIEVDEDYMEGIEVQIGELVTQLLYALAGDNIPVGMVGEYNDITTENVPIQVALVIPDDVSQHALVMARSTLLDELTKRFGEAAVEGLFDANGDVNAGYEVPLDYSALTPQVEAIAEAGAPKNKKEVRKLHSRLEKLRVSLVPFI
jgi:predicted DNA-binding antitoxin AbrB/MazE fold protein